VVVVISELWGQGGGGGGGPGVDFTNILRAAFAGFGKKDKCSSMKMLYRPNNI